jgi:hypothetical protein
VTKFWDKSDQQTGPLIKLEPSILSNYALIIWSSCLRVKNKKVRVVNLVILV